MPVDTVLCPFQWIMFTAVLRTLNQIVRVRVSDLCVGLSHLAAICLGSALLLYTLVSRVPHRPAFYVYICIYRLLLLVLCPKTSSILNHWLLHGYSQCKSKCSILLDDFSHLIFYFNSNNLSVTLFRNITSLQLFLELVCIVLMYVYIYYDYFIG